MHFIAVAMSSVSNRPKHRLGSSLNNNMSLNMTTLADNSEELVEM